MEKLKEYARTMLKTTGHEEISLSSLSSSDYSDLKELVTFLIDEFKDKGINISLPVPANRRLFSGCHETVERCVSGKAALPLPRKPAPRG